MKHGYVTVIGIIAGICTTVSFVPQIIKILKTGNTRDISLYMYIILTFGISLWVIYGILVRDIPIILANSVVFVLCLFILMVKFKGKFRR